MPGTYLLAAVVAMATLRAWHSSGGIRELGSMRPDRRKQFLRRAVELLSEGDWEPEAR